MSLTAIVALLQSALLLLTAAQSAVNLPQSFRDSAITVAKQAISQATFSLSSPQSVAATSGKYFALPNGTVVDAQGNIISAAPSTNMQATPVPLTTASTQTSSAGDSSGLSITLGQVSIATTTAYLSWTTTIPANSKVFLKLPSNGNSPQIFESAAGYSTQGFVNIPNLTPNTQYAYTIEAINGTQDQKLAGTISTNPLPTSNCTPTPSLTFSYSSSTSMEGRINLSGTYATGCNIDSSTQWTITSNNKQINQWQCMGTYPMPVGKEVGLGCDGEDFTDTDANGITSWQFALGNINVADADGVPIAFTLTVGNTSKVILLNK